MNYSLVNTAHNIGKANRSFRGNSSPTSTHSFARRLDAKQAALEDWESSFSQILSRTKQNIIKVNERYGSPHGQQGVQPPSFSSGTSRMSTLEHLGISSRHRKVGTESSDQSTATHKLADQVLLMQRLDRLENTVLHHHQSDGVAHDADNGNDPAGLGQDESKNDPPRSSPYKTNNNTHHAPVNDSSSSAARVVGGFSSLRGSADLSLNSFERRVALLESRFEQMHVQVNACWPSTTRNILCVHPLTQSIQKCTSLIQVDSTSGDLRDNQRHHASLLATVSKHAATLDHISSGIYHPYPTLPLNYQY